jgi:RHS repeat-associated protein
VQVFEPFFDAAHTFQFDRREGISSINLYDPLARPIGMIFPNKTWTKQVMGAWQDVAWDVNDTMTKSIKTDEHLGQAVRFLSEDALQPSWYDARKDGLLGVQEQKAAAKAAAHANTPTTTRFDAAGNKITIIKDNGAGGKILERATYDIDGHILQTRDGLDRVVTTHRYDMAGHALLTQSMDSGSAWELVDVKGKPMKSWDARGNRLSTEYDPLRRPVRIYAQTPGAEEEALVHHTVYGEGQPDSQKRNLRGHIFRVYDQAGVITHAEWDFKGNKLLSERLFAKEYRTVLNWADTTAVELESDIYRTRWAYDPINRAIAVTSPDQTVVKRRFNQGGYLQTVTSNLKDEQHTTSFFAASEYDAYGRAISLTAGNNTTTTETFDPLTQRLLNRTVVRRRGNARTVLQDMSYTYDPVGNVTFLRNDAEQAVFFRNGAVEPHTEYTYDAIYPLTEASGRENVGQTKGAPSGPGLPSSPAATLGDGSAMARYVEQYAYDAANNMTTLRHRLGDPQFPGWTRRFSYQQSRGDRSTNRLISTTVGNATENYTYDAHGNTTALPHLSLIEWDFFNRLRRTSQQILADGAPETTFYVYDSAGERVRKVTERQASKDSSHGPTKLCERLTVGNFETYRKYTEDGKAVRLQCKTLHVEGAKTELAIVEYWSGKELHTKSLPSRLIRFQLHDQLGSVSVELDEEGALVSYEEYTPYGTSTHYSRVTNAPTRFRYVRKERDKESGLYYFGQRYYIPWLIRWLNPDPIGTKDGLNMYNYVASNPVYWRDPHGNAKTPQPHGANQSQAHAGGQAELNLLDWRSAGMTKTVYIADTPPKSFLTRFFQGHEHRSVVVVEGYQPHASRFEGQAFAFDQMWDVHAFNSDLTYKRIGTTTLSAARINELRKERH